MKTRVEREEREKRKTETEGREGGDKERRKAEIRKE